MRNYFRYLVRSLLLALVLLGVSVGDTQARVGGQTETYGSISGSETLPGQTLAAVTKAKKKRKKKWKKKRKKKKKKKKKSEAAVEAVQSAVESGRKSSSTPATPTPATQLPTLSLDEPPPVDPFEGLGPLEFGGETSDESGKIQGTTPEQRKRFDQAVEFVRDEELFRAAQAFAEIVHDPTLTAFRDDAEYQLAKVLFKLKLYAPALSRFRDILDRGPSHGRFQRSVEWLFRLSREVIDQAPVLTELGRFTNVTFPTAYQDESRYLLAKYFFLEARRLEEVSQIAGAAHPSDSGGPVELEFGDTTPDASSSSGGVSFDFDDGTAGTSSPESGEGIELSFGDPDPAQAPAAKRSDLPQTSAGASNKALDLIRGIESGSEFYPKATYLRGLLSYLMNQDGAAVEAQRELVRILHPRTGAFESPELRQMAFMSLARIHYEYEQFDKSLYYYGNISRNTDLWLVSLFEASWAYFRRGDFDKALGNLLTLHSPFFEREYFPESTIVKAIIYYEACRFRESRQIATEFVSRFKPVHYEVRRLVESAESSNDPARLYGFMSELRSGRMTDYQDQSVTDKVLGLILADPEVRHAEEVLLEVAAQSELLSKLPDAFRHSAFAQALSAEVSEHYEKKSRLAGAVIMRRLDIQRRNLEDLLSQALKVKIEVTRAERELLQKKLRGESAGLEIVAAVSQTSVDDEHLFWPGEGEYWRDELGTYVLDFSACRQMMTD